MSNKKEDIEYDEILKELLTEENNIDQNQKEENNEMDNPILYSYVL